MVKPSLAEAVQLSKEFNYIPLSKEIFSDIMTPIEVLKILKNISKECYLFESVENGEKWGRYSFLGCNPTQKIQCKNGETFINGSKIDNDKLSILKQLEKIIAGYKSPTLNYLPSFTGGLVGYFSYEFIKYVESKLQFEKLDEIGAFDYSLMLFDKVIVFDHLRQKIIVIANMKANDIENEYREKEKEIDNIIDTLRKVRVADSYKKQTKTKPAVVEQNLTKEEFCEKVETIKKHIKEGDIFQAVLSNRFYVEMKNNSMLEFYRALRCLNPSPYMFYMQMDDLEIAGASPETLIKLSNNHLQTFPIAGTALRGKSIEEEFENEKLLLANEKECAEHNMLVDLSRNDIGKVSEFGTVETNEYMKVHKFSKVMHITSKVSGVLKKGASQIDVLSSVMPAGTLSGAPKFNAIEIIEKLEKVKRGIYGGAIGYIDFSGNLDLCIAIRTAIKKGDMLCVQAGAGIVADSIPINEYNECVNKAQALFDSVELAGEVF